MKKNTKGITLIALVITIVVLLILAGITLHFTLSGGLLEKTEQAKTETEKAKQQEESALKGWEEEIEKYSTDDWLKKNESGDSENSGNTGNSGNSGESGDSGNSGNNEQVIKDYHVDYSNYESYIEEIKTSTNVDSRRTGEKIFDNSLDSENGCWHSNSGATNQWLQINASDAWQITKFTMNNRTAYNGGVLAIKEFDLQASSDGTTWTSIAEFENMSNESEAGGTYTVNYNYNDNYYKYYRIYVKTGFENYSVIGEMTFDIKAKEEPVIEDSAVIYKFGEKNFNADDFETYNLTPSLNESNQLIFSSDFGNNGWITYKKKVDFSKVKKIKVTGKRVTGNNTYLHFYLGASGSITQGKDSSFAINYPAINNEFSYEVNITKTSFKGYATIEYCAGDIQIDSWELIKE